MSPEQSVHTIFDRVAAKDLEGLFAMVAEDAELFDCAGGTVHGKSALKSTVQEMWTGLPDIHVEQIANLSASGRVAMAEIELLGTHAGSYLGFAPTGRVVRWSSAVIYEFNESGLLVREAYYYDQASLITQLSSPPAASND